MLRTGFATVLVVIGCLLAGPAVAASVLNATVSDEQNYLDAVGPLADDPAVQTVVADQLTAAVNEKLPATARGVVDESVGNFVASDQFQPAWLELNKEVHPQLLSLLRDDGSGALDVEGDAVTLDLGVVATQLKERFAEDGVPLADQIPDVDGSVELVSGPTVRAAVPAYDLLEKLSVVLPIVAIALLVLGIALSANRGATLVVTGVGLAVAMLLLLLVRWLARGQVANNSASPDLAGPFYDALTGPVSVVVWVVCGVGGVFILVGAFLAKRSS